MNRVLLTLPCILTAGLLFSPAAAPATEAQRDLTPEVQRDLAAETRFIFSLRCAGCHGADLPKPKGRFGYVLDLARVAANRETIVPSFPDESEMRELVRRGEMPPDDSPAGPLSDREKAVIHAWIAAGAPANPPESVSLAPLRPAAGKGTAAVSKTRSDSGQAQGEKLHRAATSTRTPMRNTASNRDQRYCRQK